MAYFFLYFPLQMFVFLHIQHIGLWHHIAVKWFWSKLFFFLSLILLADCTNVHRTDWTVFIQCSCSVCPLSLAYLFCFRNIFVYLSLAEKFSLRVSVSQAKNSAYIEMITDVYRLFVCTKYTGSFTSECQICWSLCVIRVLKGRSWKFQHVAW